MTLRSETPTEYCVLGITKDDNKQFGLSKTPPRFEDLYAKGKFWIRIPSEQGVSSEFYDDADLAMKALIDRGVVKFRLCPKPMDL